MPRRGESLHARPELFWAKVTVGDPEACWPWTGTRHANGYGYVRTGAGRTTAHRHALRLSGAYVGADDVVRHRCDNPPCCNPAHLAPGTPADNMRDKVAHGNHWYLGEAQWAAKLTRPDVARIRTAYAAGGISQSELARRFGVVQSTISAVVLGRTWKAPGHAGAASH